MAQTILITLTTAGADSGPYNIYSNVDGYVTPFETAIDKASLLSGFTSYTVPDFTTIIRVQSMGVQCSNFINISIQPSTTTTTSTSSSSTTTTTTTVFIPSGPYDYYLADTYSCTECNLLATNIPVCFTAGSSIIINNFYTGYIVDNTVYQIKSINSSEISIVLNNSTGGATCAGAPCVS